METKNKLVKLAKVCYIISKVLYIIALVVCAAFIALAIALPLTDAIVTLAPQEVAIIFATLAVYAFICVGLLWNIEGLFKSIYGEQSPFNGGVNHYLKKIAIYTIVLSVVPALLGTTILRIIYPVTDVVFPISLDGIIVGVVLFLLGVFFKYGSELQKSDDETL